MLGVLARRAAGTATGPVLRSARFSTEAAAASTMMKLNFCLPHETIYKDKDVDQVIIPGAAGEYGVTMGHSPVVAEMKPGVLQILHGDGKEPEKFFVSAGFALTHPTSVTDVTAIEAVRVEEIDADAVKAEYEKAKLAMTAATDGTREHAEAQIGVETCVAMGNVIGLSLS